ncbi:UNVERIFIED_CONTAM: hypothetical protein K2H54_067402 [Gekko kuhli]
MELSTAQLNPSITLSFIEGQYNYSSLTNPCMVESAVCNFVRLCNFPVAHWNNPVLLVWGDSHNYFGRLTINSSCFCFRSWETQKSQSHHHNKNNCGQNSSTHGAVYSCLLN